MDTIHPLDATERISSRLLPSLPPRKSQAVVGETIIDSHHCGIQALRSMNLAFPFALALLHFQPRQLWVSRRFLELGT